MLLLTLDWKKRIKSLAGKLTFHVKFKPVKANRQLTFWRAAVAAAKAFLPRVLNIKLIEQLINTPLKRRRRVFHLMAGKGSDCFCRKQRKPLKTAAGWSREIGKWGGSTGNVKWKMGWRWPEEVIKASRSTWNYEVEKLIQRQVENFELSIMWKAKSSAKEMGKWKWKWKWKWDFCPACIFQFMCSSSAVSYTRVINDGRDANQPPIQRGKREK